MLFGRGVSFSIAQMWGDETEMFLETELIRRLCNELHSLTNNPNHAADRTDEEALKDYMFEYSRQKFAKKFNFDFEGKKSKPPNSKTGGTVLGVNRSFITKDFPVTKVDAEAYVTMLFG